MKTPLKTRFTITMGEGCIPSTLLSRGVYSVLGQRYTNPLGSTSRLFCYACMQIGTTPIKIRRFYRAKPTIPIKREITSPFAQGIYIDLKTAGWTYKSVWS